MNYKRTIAVKLFRRLEEPRKLIQVLAGPRQVGKTTLMLQLREALKIPVLYCTGDESPANGSEIWMDEQWEKAREATTQKKSGGILIIDEIHKILNWSQSVKRNWDKDTREKIPLRLVVTGSAQLLVQKGLSESLTGRFEVTYAPQWSFTEMKEAFGFSPEQFVWYGGYPGGASLINDEMRWKSYIRESIIRPSITQDILQMSRIDKPALLAQLFDLACAYSGQIISLQKLTGQLQDAGNVTTLANYLQLLSDAGFITGLQKYSGKAVMKRASPPKIQVHDNALMTALIPETREEAFADRSLRGRLIESSVGTHLIRSCRDHNCSLYYWRESNDEIDFVVEKGKKLLGIEIKSGKEKPNYKLAQKFRNTYQNATFEMISGDSGTTWNSYLLQDPFINRS